MAPNLGPPRLFRREMLFFAGLLALSAVEKIYTVLDDATRAGHPLPPWEPAVWEVSSHLVVWLLIPVQAWWLSQFPLGRGNLWRALPVHLAATVPYSVTHTLGMVVLRKLAYGFSGATYTFGAVWENGLYEYRKDFVTYWVLVLALMAFRVYGDRVQSRTAPGAGLGDEGSVPVGGSDTRGGAVVRDSTASAAAHSAPGSPVPAGRLLVRKRNREFILDAQTIDRLEADGNYVVVYAGGENYRLRDSLEALSRRLGEQRFARVHRSHVVNIDRIREIQPWDHGDYRILLTDGSMLNLSRRYRSRLSQIS